MREFELNGNEYIELNKLLKLLRIAQSGGEAKDMIMSEVVYVNDTVETQIRKKLRTGDVVKFEDQVIAIK